jgi:preprotein translocase subunit SecD
MASDGKMPRLLNQVAVVAVLGFVLGCSNRQPEPSPLPAEQSPDPGKVTVEFRRAEMTPGENLTGVRSPQTGETIYLHPEVEVTSDDIAEAAAGMNGGRHEVLIRFTKAGGEKMARLYEGHRDRPVAILVNGRVVCAFRLTERVTEFSSIHGAFTAEEVNRIVDGINRR